MSKKFCGSCGTELDTAMGALKFCPNCGAKIEEMVPQQEETPVIPDNVQPAADVPESPVQPEIAAEEAPVPEPESAAPEVPYAPEAEVPAEGNEPYFVDDNTAGAPAQQETPEAASGNNYAYAAQQPPVYGQTNGNAEYPGQQFPYQNQPNSPYQAPVQQAPAKKKTGMKIAIAAVAVIVIGVILFFILKPRYIEEINIAEGSVVVDIDEDYKIEYSVEPENYKGDELRWKSSDKSVATVKNGKITPVSEGTCIITVKSENEEAELKVEVQTLPNEITVSSDAIDVATGESRTITAIIEPEEVTDDTVTWTSSDETIATVADGVVTGVGEGTCTVTATTVNGLESECTVTVTRPAYMDMIVGVFTADYVYYEGKGYDADAVDFNMTLTVNENGTATALVNGDTVQFTWRFTYEDSDGDYEFIFTNSKGGTFEVEIIRDPEYSNLYGELEFVISSDETVFMINGGAAA